MERPRNEAGAEGPAATFERTQTEGEPKAQADESTEATPAQEATAEPVGIPVAEMSIEQLRSAVTAQKAQADDYLEQWRRAAADFANFRRRSEQERAEMGKLFNESLVKSLLPVLDNFERAIASMPAELKGNSWTDGVALTEKALRTVLEKEGLCVIEAKGQKFDPNLHEAVAHDASDEHEDDHVIEEFQKGYKLGDRVIRPSMVKVSKRS